MQVGYLIEISYQTIGAYLWEKFSIKRNTKT